MSTATKSERVDRLRGKGHWHLANLDNDDFWTLLADGNWAFVEDSEEYYSHIYVIEKVEGGWRLKVRNWDEADCHLINEGVVYADAQEAFDALCRHFDEMHSGILVWEVQADLEECGYRLKETELARV